MVLSQLIRVLVLSLLSFGVSMAFAPLWLGILKKLRFGKQIRKEGAPIYHQLHKKKEGTPTAGGVIVWLPILILIFFIWIFSKLFDGFFGYLNIVNRAQTYLPLAAFFGTAVIGLVDDILGTLKIGEKGGGLSVRIKIIIYTLISLIGASWFYFKLHWDIIHIPLIGNWQIGGWYVFLFVFVLIASAFSANETDGLDGLLGGTMMVAFLAEGVVSFLIGKYDLTAFIAMIFGALLAFLWENIYPAKLFGGDTLSMSLGISLGVIAILTNTIFLLPFFAFIPLLESISVIFQISSKKIRKKKIFISTPIHHHLEAKGWLEPQITMRFWLVSWFLAALGLIIFFLDKFISF